MRSGNYSEVEEEKKFFYFKCSSGFADRLKKRREITYMYKAVCDESESVDRKFTDYWINNKLTNLIADYEAIERYIQSPHIPFPTLLSLS